MRTEKVDTWLDAGTADAIIETNRYLLDHGRDNSHKVAALNDTVIIPPVNIHPSATVSASILGPHLCLGEDTVVEGSILKDSIVGPGAHITNCLLETSLIGHNATLSGQTGKFRLGDNSSAIA